MYPKPGESNIVVYETEGGYKADINFNYGFDGYSGKYHIGEASIVVKTKNKKYAEKKAKEYLKKHF